MERGHLYLSILLRIQYGRIGKSKTIFFPVVRRKFAVDLIYDNINQFMIGWCTHTKWIWKYSMPYLMDINLGMVFKIITARWECRIYIYICLEPQTRWMIRLRAVTFLCFQVVNNKNKCERAYFDLWYYLLNILNILLNLYELSGKTNGIDVFKVVFKSVNYISIRRNVRVLL